MPDGLLIAMFVEMRGQKFRVESEMPVQKAGYVNGRRLNGGQNLDSVAGGDNHALGHSGHGSEGACGLRQLLAGDGDALAQLDGRGLVIDADECQSHCGPYLWMRLMTLAASTTIMMRKTAPESMAARRPRKPALRRTKSRVT